MDLNEFNNMFGGEEDVPAVPPTTVKPPEASEGSPEQPAQGEAIMLFSPQEGESEHKPSQLLETSAAFNQLFKPVASGPGIMDIEIDAILPPFPTGARAPVVGAHFGLNRAAVHVNPSKGLPVTLQAYDNMQEGDLIEVFWSLVGSPTPVAVLTVSVSREQAEQGTDIASHVPVERAVVGFAQWYVRVTRASSQNPEESRKLTVFYKDTLPGGPDRRPHEPWHSELHAAQLELPASLTPGLQIPVTVDAYPQMRVRDVITLSVGGIFFTHTITEGEVDNQVGFLIAADQLESIKDLESISVVWRVHDEVENYSEKWSAELLLTPEFEDDGLLEAPEVRRLDGNPVEEQLSLEDLGSQALHVVTYVMRPIVRLGDVLRFRYEVTTAEGQRFAVTLADILIRDAADERYPGERFATIPNADVVRAANGQLRVSYEVYRAGVQVQRSYRRTLVVQGVVQRLPAPSVNEAIGPLLPGDLSAITAGISWPGMMLGDRTQLVLSGASATGALERTVPLARVSQNEASVGRMERSVDEQFSQLNGGRLTVSYLVGQAGAGQQSSAPLHLLVGEQTDLLPPPIVVGVENSLLFPGSPVTVQIPDSALRDDTSVTLSWIGRSAAATFTDTQLSDAGVAMSFTVPADRVAAGVRQPVQVSYAVRTRKGVQLSSSVTVIIADAATPWDRRAPVSMEAQGETLDPASIPLTPGATFNVDFQGMLPLSQVRLVLDSPLAGQGFTSEIQTIDQIGPLTFQVPRSVILANLGQSIIVRYQRKRYGQDEFAFSNPLALKVSPALSVDQSTMVLNRVSIKMSGRPRSGLDSIGNTAVRVATGGRAPYAYSSSHPAIASVNAQGKVVGERNGNATITVRDAGGQSVSYSVQVSNVFRVILGASRSPAQYIPWVNANGRLLQPEHWADLARVYTRPFDGNTWIGYTNQYRFVFWNYWPNAAWYYLGSGADRFHYPYACIAPY